LGLLPLRLSRLLVPSLRIVLRSPHVPVEGLPPHDAVPAHPVADLIGVVSPGRLHELLSYCLDLRDLPPTGHSGLPDVAHHEAAPGRPSMRDNGSHRVGFR